MSNTRFNRLCFLELKNKLDAARYRSFDLYYDFGEISSKANNYSDPWDLDLGEGFSKLVVTLARSAFAARGRKRCTTALNEHRKKCRDFISSYRQLIAEANSWFSARNIPPLEFEDNINFSDYHLDTSASNKAWYKQLDSCTTQMQKTLLDFCTACSKASKQFDYFIDEKHATETIRLILDGSERSVNIEWQQVANLPCDPKTIHYIKTDGSLWLVCAWSENHYNLFRSNDGESWHKIIDDAVADISNISDIAYIHDTWVIFPRHDKAIIYSQDALTWKKSSYPVFSNQHAFSVIRDLLYFKGRWLWHCTEHKEHEYAEKGIFVYKKSVLYYADKLSGEWKRWADSPEFDEGIEVQKFYVMPGRDILLASCQYSHGYTKWKKKAGTLPFFSHLIPDQSWGHYYPLDTEYLSRKKADFLGKAVFTEVNGKLACFYSHILSNSYYLVSDNGYDWTQQSIAIRVRKIFKLDRFTLLTSDHNSSPIYFLQGEALFNELILGEGKWQKFTAANQGILAIYKPTIHKTFLMYGKVVVSN